MDTELDNEENSSIKNRNLLNNPLFFISSIFIYSNVQNECFVLELLEQTEQKKIFVYI